MTTSLTERWSSESRSTRISRSRLGLRDRVRLSDRLARSHESALIGGDDRLDPTAEVELREDPVEVGLQGREAHLELGGDLVVREPARYEDEHVALARGQVT